MQSCRVLTSVCGVNTVLADGVLNLCGVDTIIGVWY